MKTPFEKRNLGSCGRPRLVLVGGSGRVASALSSHFELNFELVQLGRKELQDATEGKRSIAELSARVRGAVAILNAAGRAHLHKNEADTGGLVASNVILPCMLAEIAIAAATPLVHLSSTKAGLVRPDPYGFSKLTAERMLEARFKREMAPRPSLIIVRTCAVLAPPYEAGKLSVLARLPRSAARNLPPVVVPVVAPAALAQLIVEAIKETGDGSVKIVEVPRSSMVTLQEAGRKVH